MAANGEIKSVLFFCVCELIKNIKLENVALYFRSRIFINIAHSKIISRIKA